METKKVAQGLIIVALGFSLATVIITRINTYTEKYDYASIYSVKGTVTEVSGDYFSADLEGWSWKETVRLITGDEIKIEIGGAVPDAEGDEVTVYTDGQYYSFTREGVALENDPKNLLMFLVACVLYGGSMLAALLIIFKKPAKKQDRKGSPSW